MLSFALIGPLKLIIIIRRARGHILLLKLWGVSSGAIYTADIAFHFPHMLVVDCVLCPSDSLARLIAVFFGVFLVLGLGLVLFEFEVEDHALLAVFVACGCLGSSFHLVSFLFRRIWRLVAGEGFN